jgi:outer membrane protein
MAFYRPFLPEPNSIDQWTERAERRNLAVLSQQIAVEIATRGVAEQRAGHLPTVTLFASDGRTSAQSNTTTFIGSTVSSRVLGVQMTIPLFSGGSVVGKTDVALAVLNQAREQLENMRRTASLGASQSFLDVTNGVTQVIGLEAALKSNEISLESNKRGYKAGLRINLDVLNAVQQLYTTKRDLSKARNDTIVNGIKLRAAVGALGEKDVQEMNRLLSEPD